MFKTKKIHWVLGVFFVAFTWQRVDDLFKFEKWLQYLRKYENMAKWRLLSAQKHHWVSYENPTKIAKQVWLWAIENMDFK